MSAIAAAVIAGGAALIGGGLNFFGNRKNSKDAVKIQEAATEQQKLEQEKYNKQYGFYQKNILSLMDKRPELKNNLTSQEGTLNDYTNQVKQDLYSSQGRAVGSEARRDDIRQGSADMLYRASQASRTGSDLMGAIGRIQTNESSELKRLGTDEARERQARIDTKTTALGTAVKANSMFDAAAKDRFEMAKYNDEMDRYDQRLNFTDTSTLNQLQSNLNFAQGNINQQAANGATQIAGRQYGGDQLMALAPSILDIGAQQTQLKMEQEKYKNESGK